LSVNYFCGVEVVRAVEITVRDGAPLSVTYEDTGERADRELFSRFDTVGELFDVLDAAFDEDAASVSAEYDAEFAIRGRCSSVRSGTSPTRMERGGADAAAVTESDGLHGGGIGRSSRAARLP
jgi:hypothetical protein